MVAPQKILPMPYAQNLCISPYVQETLSFFSFLVLPYCVFLPCVSPSLLTQTTGLLTPLVTECVCVCVWGGPHTMQFSVTPSGCPQIQLDSNTIYLERVSGLTV